MSYDSPAPHTLGALAERAKTELLRAGSHRPTFIVDGTKGREAIAVDALPRGSIERQLLAYRLGAHIPANRRRKVIGPLAHVAFIAEAWEAPIARLADWTPSFRAETAPGATEVLVITTYDVAQGTLAGCSYEMLRNRRGHLHDLLARPEGGVVLEHALMDAFLAGYAGLPLTTEGEN